MVKRWGVRAAFAGISRAFGAAGSMVMRFTGDNPLFMREIRQRLGGSRVSFGVLVLGLLQGAGILIAHFSLDRLNLAYTWMGYQQLEFTLGDLAELGWTIGLMTFAVLAVPVRVYGLFDWERRGEGLDQHIASGASPILALGGKLALLTCYATVLLVAVLPFAYLVHLLGAKDIAGLVQDLALSFAFAFAMFGGFVWLSMYLPEFVAAITVCVIGILLLAITHWSFTDCEELMAILPLADVYRRTDPLFSMDYSGTFFGGGVNPTIFGHSVSIFASSMTMLLTIGVLGLARGVIGPLPVGVELGSTFGTLIADRKSRFGRFVGSTWSRRRADLRFLYQNRARWLCASENWLFDIHSLVTTVLVVGLIFGLYWNDLIIGDDAVTVFMIIIAILVTILAVARATRSAALHAGGKDRWLVTRRFCFSTLECFVPAIVLSVGAYSAATGPMVVGSVPEELIVGLLAIGLHGTALTALGVLVGSSRRKAIRPALILISIVIALHLLMPILFHVAMGYSVDPTWILWMVEVSLPAALNYTVFNNNTMIVDIMSGDLFERRALSISMWPTIMTALLLLFGSVFARNKVDKRQRERDTQPKLVLAVTIALMSALATARDAPAPMPQLELRCGYNEMASLHPLSPIAMIVSAEENFEGVLELVDAYTGRTIVREQIEVAAGAARRFSALVECGVGGAYLARVRAVDDGRVLERSGTMVRPVHGGQEILFVDSKSPAPLSSQFDEYSPTPLGILASDLPDQARLFAFMRAIVIGRAPQGALGGSQQEALSAYVAAGGHLIVTTGGRAESLSTQALGQVVAGVPPPLPGTSMALPCLGALGLSEWQSQPVTVSDLTPLLAGGGRVLLAAGETVLAVEFERGAGKLIVLAVDPWAAPLFGSTAASGLVNSLIAPFRRHPQSLLLDARANTQGNTGGFRFIVIAILIVILFTVIAPWLIGRVSGRPHAPWILTAPAAMVAILALEVGMSNWFDMSPEVFADRIEWRSATGGIDAEELFALVRSRGVDDSTIAVDGEWSQFEFLESVVSAESAEFKSLDVRGAFDGASQHTRIAELELDRWETYLLHSAALRERDDLELEVRIRLDARATGQVKIEGSLERFRKIILVAGGSVIELQDFTSDAGAGSWFTAPGIFRGSSVRNDVLPILGEEKRRSDDTAFRDLVGHIAGQSLNVVVESERLRSSPRAFALLRGSPAAPGEPDGIRVVSVPMMLEIDRGVDIEVPLNLISLQVVGVVEPATPLAADGFAGAAYSSNRDVIMMLSWPRMDTTCDLVQLELNHFGFSKHILQMSGGFIEAPNGAGATKAEPLMWLLDPASGEWTPVCTGELGVNGWQMDSALPKDGKEDLLRRAQSMGVNRIFIRFDHRIAAFAWHFAQWEPDRLLRWVTIRAREE